MTPDEATKKVRATISHMLMARATSWWGFLLCSFDLTPSNSCPTMGLGYSKTNLRPQIVYGVDFVNQLSTGKIASVLIHECLHYLQMVFLRKGMRDMERWNVSADGPINWKIDHDYGDNGTTKWTKAIQLPVWESANGEECKPVRLPDTITHEQRYSEWIYDNMDKDSGLQEMFSKMGTEYIVIDDHSLWGDFNNIPEEILKSSIISSIRGASNAAGSTPSGIQEILDSLLDSKVEWRQVLKDFVGQNQKIGKKVSWKRPNRRFPKTQPGHLALRSGTIVFIIDTSGSMSKEELSQAMAEIDSIASTYEVWVVDCDADVQQEYKYRRGLELTVKGRGGTDMNPALKHADVVRHADMIICFTDGHLFAAPVETSAKQLWVITKLGSTDSVKDRHFVQIEG